MHDWQFVRRPSDGRFVANIRLVKQSSAAPCLGLARAETIDLQEATPTATEPPSPGVPPTLQRFASLVRLVRPHTRSLDSRLTWYLYAQLESKPPKALGSMCTKESRLVRLMNDIYDARFEVLASGAASVRSSLRRRCSFASHERSSARSGPRAPSRTAPPSRPLCGTTSRTASD